LATLSRNETIKKSELRAKEISEWINKTPNSKIQGQKHPAFVKGVQVELDVYELPRYLLRLNPDNWRFRAEFNKIKARRQKLGKSLELDPDNEDDKNAIRDLLKGLDPKNEKRKERYNELKKDFIANSKNGSNGQTVPGTILYDGTYINGNRRDTILEDLSKHTPPGCQPSQFQTIRVVILSKDDVTVSDIKANETREQISLDSRERYDYTNSALMVDDYIQHLINVEKLTEEEAVRQIANQVFGLEAKDVQEYVNFKKTADVFLETIGLSGQYSYIQDVGKEKDEGGIVQILNELESQKQKILDFKLSPTKTSKLIKALYAYSWYSKEKPKHRDSRSGKLKPLNFNARAFRIFKREAFDSTDSMDKLIESGTIDKIDFKNPQDHALAFESDILRAINITNTTKATLQPLVFLEDASEKISRVNRELSGIQGDDIKSQILQKHGLDYIAAIKKNITEIFNKVAKSARKR